MFPSCCHPLCILSCKHNKKEHNTNCHPTKVNKTQQTEEVQSPGEKIVLALREFSSLFCHPLLCNPYGMVSAMRP